MGYLLLGKEYRDLPNISLYDEKEKCDARSLATLGRAQPGDLILVRTRRTGFAFGRRLTRNHYDHIAVVLHNNETMNIIMPKTVRLPLSTFSKPGNDPLILRPNWRTPEQREKFIAEIQGFMGGTYNLNRTLLGVLLTFLSTWVGIRIRMRKLGNSASKWICTEAIIVSLLKTFPDFKAINGIKLDYHVLGFATTNDFLRISKKFPDLLRIERVN